MKNLPDCEDELVRFAVRRIKALETLRAPRYELPADSFIEEAVRDIIVATKAVVSQ